MCLTISNEFDQIPVVAKEDIFCYKVVEFFDNKYFTYYKGCCVEIGRTYLSTLVKDSWGDIEEGLHSFTTLNDAKMFLDDEEPEQKQVAIIKCIIPTGSVYYQGIFSIYKAYASDMIKYIELCNQN